MKAKTATTYEQVAAVRHAARPDGMTAADMSAAWESRITCPFCGSDCAHPTFVRVLPAGRLRAMATIDAEGVHLDMAKAPIGRGVRITLGFLCENGCGWVDMLGFHKGTLFYLRQEQPEERHAPTLWRD